MGHFQEQLDRIPLDDFEVKRPSGALIKPHAGQSVWVHGYGRAMADVMKAQAGETADEKLQSAVGFLAGEIVKWDIINPRTGEPYPDPSRESIMLIPDELFAFITRRVFGAESEGEGGAASGG